MSEVSESITRGLEEALEYAKGNLKCRSFVVKFEPLPEYAPEDDFFAAVEAARADE
jgi:hypothetical protein